MQLFLDYLKKEVADCVKNGIRLSVIGRRDRLSAALRGAIEHAESATAHGRALNLRVAVDYSSRDSILGAARRLTSGESVDRESFARLIAEINHAPEPESEVDLLIRTGGEQRLSDFLLWECAYAELHFTQRMWPEFAATDLESAVADFRSRERRFGEVEPPRAAVG